VAEHLFGLPLLGLLRDQEVQVGLRLEPIPATGVVKVEELFAQVMKAGRDDIAVQFR
jgi:hypothetical protein